ncbi:hypothetical protein AB0N05_25025 [Nocardia sp. NPDC051030]|uniref:hypothetical protein n=1 Tax=Nocardia sp. NPDC051030 TaxID=3155162 RepID=UPI0034149998
MITNSPARGPFGRASVLLFALLACGAHTAASAAAEPDSTTWYVSAGAAPGSVGSAEAPFDSLARVEAASRDGDTIVVQAAAAALDGGIALKPGQQLIGDPVPNGAGLPRITNTTSAHDGDAVRLATGAQVRNLVIAGARRGGIYGSDAADVVISGNDVSATNQQCADGFMIGPFGLPPTLPLGLAAPALPDFITLNNGWAAIMTDFSAAAGSVRIEGNTVHDTACGDGIDVRAHGNSQVTAQLTGNTLRTINLGLVKLSVLAIGIQAGDTARLTADLVNNTETDIAAPTASVLNAVADSEGVFLNALGRARMDITISGNDFRNGSGNFSANGLEYVTTSGSPQSEVHVTDSTFENVTGDLIENYNLSTGGAHQSLTLDNVRAHHSTFPGALLNSLVPANLGTCVVTTNFGRTAHTDLTITNSDLADCSADGIGLIAYTPTGSNPSTSELIFDIRDTTLNGAAANGINIINVGDTAALRGSLTRVAISAAQQALLHTSNSGGTIATASLDLSAVTLDGAALDCLTGHPRVALSGLPATCH